MSHPLSFQNVLIEPFPKKKKERERKAKAEAQHDMAHQLQYLCGRQILTEISMSLWNKISLGSWNSNIKYWKRRGIMLINRLGMSHVPRTIIALHTMGDAFPKFKSYFTFYRISAWKVYSGSDERKSPLLIIIFDIHAHNVIPHSIYFWHTWAHKL